MDHVVGKKTAVTYRLDSAAEIGQGVEGRVFLAGNRAVKVFSDPPGEDRVGAIEALLGLGRKVPGFAWPTELVCAPASGEVRGFAMEIAPGESLESLLEARETRTIPAHTKARLALRVATAVADAHAQRGPKIVLGDVLKAGNLVIDGDECVFVDAASVSLFGFRDRGGDVLDSISTLTTPGYVPKEVLENPGAIPSPMTDLFAMAVVLFEILLGRPPHEPRPCPASIGLEPDDAVRRGLFPRWVAHPDFEAPSYDPIDLPDEVDRLFRAAFLASAIRPTALEWCGALEPWLEALAAKSGPTRRRRRRLRLLSVRLRRWAAWAARIATVILALYVISRFALWGLSLFPAPRNDALPPAPGRPVGPPTYREIFR